MRSSTSSGEPATDMWVIAAGSSIAQGQVAPKGPEPATLKANAELAKTLPFANREDFDDAMRGFVGTTALDRRLWLTEAAAFASLTHLRFDARLPLARDIVACFRTDHPVAGSLEETGYLERGRNRNHEIIVERDDHAGGAGDPAASACDRAAELVRLTGVYHNLLREWSDV